MRPPGFAEAASGRSAGAEMANCGRARFRVTKVDRLDPVGEEDEEDELLKQCFGGCFGGNPQDVSDEFTPMPAAPLGIPLPPGLSLPPGLDIEAPIAPLDDCAKPQYWVRINGLPNNLLTENMMEAMFQQAGLSDAVISAFVEESEPCGRALIGFTSSRAALRCAAHFHGNFWDRSGMQVMTEAFETGAKDCALTGASAQEMQVASQQGWSLPLGGEYEFHLHETQYPLEENPHPVWPKGSAGDAKATPLSDPHGLAMYSCSTGSVR